MKNQAETLQQYISDMLSVERHIHEAVSRQLEEDQLPGHPKAKSLVSQIETTTRRHVESLEEHLRSVGGDPSKTIKDTVTSALGKAAGAVDKVRDDRISTELRDDYTALNMAAISYIMLHTTALSLDEGTTATLAQSHLEELTPLIIQINEVMPHVVARELGQETEGADTNVGERAVQNTRKAWDAEHVHKGHSHQASA